MHEARLDFKEVEMPVRAGYFKRRELFVPLRTGKNCDTGHIIVRSRLIDFLENTAPNKNIYRIITTKNLGIDMLVASNLEVRNSVIQFSLSDLPFAAIERGVHYWGCSNEDRIRTAIWYKKQGLNVCFRLLWDITDEKSEFVRYVDEIVEIYQVFDRVYLTNTAQAGKELILSVGGAFSSIIKPASTGFTQIKDSDGNLINPAEEDSLAYITSGGGTLDQASATASNDSTFRLTTTSTVLRDVLIQVLSNDAYMGDSTAQEIELNVGDVVGFTHPVDVSTIYFKNRNAGQNTKIVMQGITVE